VDTLVVQNHLSAAEKAQLARQYASLVRSIAKRMAQKLPDHVELDDLVQDGAVGLMDALNRFDPSKGIQFQTYATSRIRGAILDSLRSGDWVSRGARRRARELSTHEEQLAHSLGRQPQIEEIAAVANLTPAEIRRRKHESSSLTVVSLQQQAASFEDESCWADQLVDESAMTEDAAMRACKKELLFAGLQGLKERERTILWLYYFEELAIREIGEIFGVSEARISQIHGRCLRKLREQLEAADQIQKKAS
jgi:RNA polymerase sigma factor FliA